MPGEDVKTSVPELTELQLKCLEGFWNRRSAKQIAAELKISEAWVNKNLMSARRQLNVNSSADAAAIVFGGKRGSIKNYYYQETDLTSVPVVADQGIAGTGALAFEPATSERPLINGYGPLVILAGIVLTALASIIGVTLLIDAGDGMYQLWKALGY
jgi:DNA-binding CsgD family transcriptional regulator